MNINVSNILKNIIEETFPDKNEIADRFIKGNITFYSNFEISKCSTYINVKNGQNNVKVELLKLAQRIIQKFYKERSRITDDFENSYKNSDDNNFSILWKNGRNNQRRQMRELWETNLPLEASVSVKLLPLLMRSKIDLNESDFFEVLNERSWHLPLTYYFKNLESYIKKHGLSDSMQSFLTKCLEKNFGRDYEEKAKLKIKEILLDGEFKRTEEVDFDLVLLDDKDDFGRMVNSFVASLNPDTRKSYSILLDKFKKAVGSRPNKNFVNEVQKQVSKIGHEKYINQIKHWLDFLSKLNVQIIKHSRTSEGQTYSYDEITYISKVNQIAIKGLIWSIENLIDSEILGLLRVYAEKCFSKIPKKGVLAPSVGNVCIDTLSQAGIEGISHLSRLRYKIKQSNAQGIINFKIWETAKELGLTPDEVEDMSIQDYGVLCGKLEYTLDRYKVKLLVSESGKTQLDWFKLDGTDEKKLKSKPSALSKLYSNQIKIIKKLADEIQQVLTVQRDRLNFSIIDERRINYSHFDKFYFSHSLMTFLTKRLIWSFYKQGEKESEFSAICVEGKWLRINGGDIPALDNDFEVQIWNPISKTVKEVLLWREILEKFKIQQPFKQAHREVYILTEAERQTNTYSNRMAAHILKQYQFNSLAKLRGWSYSLLGSFDGVSDSGMAQIYLKQNIRAEFWVNAVKADDEFSNSGMWNFVSTDQIRFYQNGQILRLDNVPALVFSEVMRDVDLFVGVSSVGNDPNWQDNPARDIHQNYWQNYSFGDLSEIGKTRKGVLEKLIPRLKISKLCQVQEKFLVVKGKIRTYKIHLGSGNILMEPNDQYLCIVPDKKSAGIDTNRVFLPFEGDSTLSIILSKAFLLAEDSKITDPIIVGQLMLK
jgi:hypothetical protein